MKNKLVIIIVLISLFLITGCKKNTVEVNGKKVSTSGMGHKHCIRNASAGDNITTNLSYEIYYKDDILNVLESIEEIKTTDQNTLDEYEKAYENINNNYEGLMYYDSKVTRTDDSVSRHTTIDYDKINIEELLKIEGEKDNIIENGKAKLQLWLDLAKKFGAKCEEVDE